MTEISEYSAFRSGGRGLFRRPVATVGCYEQLLGADWQRLPSAVRRRFADGPSPGTTRLYCGTVLATELNRAGRVLAFAARLAGGPMPFTNGAIGATTVAVTLVDDLHGSGKPGQVWTRSYARAGAFPQVIQSAKCFSGRTGLEERLGYGLAMVLEVTAERVGSGIPDATSTELVFTSSRYRLDLGWLSIVLPNWLSPGRCQVRHRDEGIGTDGAATFTFTLTIEHPWFGRLIRQVARYREAGTF